MKLAEVKLACTRTMPSLFSSDRTYIDDKMKRLQSFPDDLNFYMGMREEYV
jgi:hypothetical protein